MENKCKFERAWIGACKQPANETGFCEEHKKIKCVSCEAQATHECSETGQLVCGAPLCDDCEHTNAVNGTNGNVGFFRTSALPEGMKEHCKKSEQKCLPWYMAVLANDDEEIAEIIKKFDKGEISYLDAMNQINLCALRNLRKKDV